MNISGTLGDWRAMEGKKYIVKHFNIPNLFRLWAVARAILLEAATVAVF